MSASIRTFHAGPQSLAVWERVRPILEEIEGLEFLDQLAQGSLDARAFVQYILQDGIYLEGYSRAMSLLAARAPEQEEARFWNRSSADAVEMETVMQADLLKDDRFAGFAQELAPGGVAKASPTTLGYVSYLVATAATQPYATGVAGVLPCFWVYAHMGKVLVERAGDLTDNPYAAWVEAYDSEEFDSAVDQAVALYEKAAEATTEAGRKQMAEAFEQATIYELHFWATAARFQDWSL